MHHDSTHERRVVRRRANRLRRALKRARRSPAVEVAQSDREGSTLVVVVSLLALLSVLGITINLYTAQEAESAKFLSEGAKVRTDPGLDPDALFDYGIEQLILGTSIEQSALYGGRHSILPNMFGRDNHPYSGRGINVVDLDGDGVPDVDQEYDGNPTASGTTLLELNDSGVVDGGAGRAGITTTFPHPDPDYTAPDINATWLAFEGWGLDKDGMPVKVVLPSFHRPQYLRETGAWQPVRTPDVAAPMGDEDRYVARMLRPHIRHRIAGGGNNSRRFIVDEATTGIDFNGDGSLDDPIALGVLKEFPFGLLDHGVWHMQEWKTGDYEVGDWVYPTNANRNGWFYRCIAAGNDSGSEPTWPTGEGATVSSGATWEAHSQPRYTFDADADGDGDNESIYLDLGFPVQERGDKILYVPMFAFQVLDADALGNVNVHGNYAGNVNPDQGTETFGSIGGGAAFLSRSNEGLTPSEVNLGWVLNADPNTSTASDLARLNFLFKQNFDNTSTSWQELSNAELFTLLTGIVHGDTGEVVAGRYGEAAQMLNTWDRIVNQNATNVADDFPYPGQSNVDDNSDLGFGEHILDPWQPNRGYTAGQNWVYATLQDNEAVPNTATVLLACVSSGTSDSSLPSVDSLAPGHIFSDGSSAQWMIFTKSFYSFGTPYDIRGTGNGPYLLSGTTPNVYTGYDNIGSHGFLKPSLTHQLGQLPGPQRMFYGAEFSGRNMRNTPHRDDPVEMFWADGNLDGVYADGVARDAAFTASDAAFLRYSQAVLDSKGTNSRLSKLVAWNLFLNYRADEIRKRLTPVSWDLRVRGTQGSAGTNEIRGWEYAGNEFPPQFGSVGKGTAADPLRPAVRELLKSTILSFGTNTPVQDVLQRMLSVNHVVHPSQAGNDGIHGTADDVASARPVFSRLTPHPTRIVNTAVGTMDTSSMNSGQLQEFGARRDRQLLARDIYVLLYLLGGGRDGVDYATTDNADNTGTRALYNDDQLEEMARFAVNFVDQLDPDDVITKFEYDKNLFDGWNLDDRAYGDPSNDTATLSDDKGVVFGVERQTLTFSEALAIIADVEASSPPEDIDRTEWNDEEIRDWVFLELRNASDSAIGFENEAWKIVIQPVDKTASALYRARHLIPTTGGVDPGRLFTIGTAGDAHLTDGTNPAPTRFRVDRTTTDMSTPAGASFTDAEDVQFPASALDLDLIDPNHELFFRLHGNDDTVGRGVAVSDPPITSLNAHEDGDAFENDDDMAKGDFLNIIDPMRNDAKDGTTNLEFVLMRRAHLYREAPVTPTAMNDTAYDPQSLDNPWIEVDRITTRLHDFVQLDKSMADAVGAPSTVDGALDDLPSSARSEPLVRDEEPDSNAVYAATDVVKNSIGSLNKVTTDELGGNFAVRQFHRDADFTSPIDLFLVPLFGPHELTKTRKTSSQPLKETTGLTDLTNAADIYDVTLRRNYPNLAGAKKFLKPVAQGGYGDDNLPGNGGTDWTDRQAAAGDNEPDPDPGVAGAGTAGTWKYDNRWYRLLGVVEAPSPMVDVTDANEDFAFYRVPGRINWNTLRYPEVLAAMLDDEAAVTAGNFTPLQEDLDPTTPLVVDKQSAYLQDANEAARDWWTQFLLSRDGIDTVSGLVLPGTPDSKPFRSLSYVTGEQGNPLGIEQTVLRGLPVDDGLVRSNVLGRRLFELGTRAQRYGVATPPSSYNDRAGHAVDPETRNRVLSKVWNNSTTRSNVFFVHVQVDFFQVDTSGTRIGGKLDDMPTHRGFFVVDRSRAFELLEPADFGGAGFSFNGPANNGFDYRNLILYREVIQ